MMRNKPAVSVIMSEYNTDTDILKASILSILEQEFTDFELIIVDDCGKSALYEVVNSFNDKRLRVIKNASNIGLALSLNKAINNSRADYLVRMDTDDIALPERLGSLYEFAVNHPQYDVVGSLAMEFSSQGDHGVLSSEGEKTKRSLMRGDSLVHPSVIMKKKVLKDIGGYKVYKRAEDLGLWCELVLNGYRLFVIDKILLRYRVNIEDYKKRSLKNRTGEIKVRLKYYPKFNANPIDYLFIVKSILAGALPYRMVRFYRNAIVLKKGRKI